MFFLTRIEPSSIASGILTLFHRVCHSALAGSECFEAPSLIKGGLELSAGRPDRLIPGALSFSELTQPYSKGYKIQNPTTLLLVFYSIQSISNKSACSQQHSNSPPGSARSGSANTRTGLCIQCFKSEVWATRVFTWYLQKLKSC